MLTTTFLSSISPFWDTLLFRFFQLGVFNPILIIFAIILTGYLIGKINIKGISLGSAGVFVSALIFGILLGEFHQQINSFGHGFSETNADLIGWLNTDTALIGPGAAINAFRTFGLVFFIAGIGLIAGTTFFKSFKKNAASFITMGFSTTLTGAIIVIVLIATGAIGDPAMATGLLMGALSTTPGLSAAQETFYNHEAIIATANGIAYPFGVLGIVLFIQIMPKILRLDMRLEAEKLKAMMDEKKGKELDIVIVGATQGVLHSSQCAVKDGENKANTTQNIETDGQNKGNTATKPVNNRTLSVENCELKKEKKPLITVDKLGIFPIALVIVIGLLAGSLSFRAGNAVITLAATGGVLITGLLLAHFGKLGRLSMKVPDATAKMVREFGLVMFLATVGFSGGLNFVSIIGQYPMLLLWGAVMTMAPVFVSFYIGKLIFKMDIVNNMGGMTGSMTSTPGLGALVHASKSEEGANAYAAAYPIALFTLIFVPQIVLLIFGGN